MFKDVSDSLRFKRRYHGRLICNGIAGVGRGNNEVEGEERKLGSRIFTLVSLTVEHSASKC